ncbi:helix-turn-helix transcriptional regulator [Acidipropionibacterium jensenii]|uniref:helix-turn-helix transcriptional regulator n=1 Tax=Acidipropionibacterium jensenii TaxID=1749 RepID=UPI002647BA5D|nr:helix-turn-helix domain-containing protein [Acidipropionibacterium jensenii]MDN6017676.1 helix-turn-helix domain-containing protein [Bifidobacterium mongoliense]MDN6556375.1 helix-turn-helix domain-containing protein [Acidipropionibacterium acidipropionici]MDN5977992.1 helix-turn-helix domain-containing protein [Acidipropionibacterium jensenii]MDN5996796.1 helix-turn-helix domain-containing protein [Acidipropionibacterium jensenii]MDN6427407.1 helix-turn-helix domain-containing protein [Aci
MPKTSKPRGTTRLTDKAGPTGMAADDLLSTADVSREYGFQQATLRGWRHVSTTTGNGVGPKSFKVGAQIRYRRSDVEQWLADQYAATVRGEGVVVSR